MLDRPRDGQVHASSFLQTFPSKIGPMQKVSVITFDADGTLWDFRLVMRRALSHVQLNNRRSRSPDMYHELGLEPLRRRHQTGVVGTRRQTRTVSYFDAVRLHGFASVSASAN